ncbi:MAG: c-type cytochrome [Gemmatimonadales bacterium]
MTPAPVASPLRAAWLWGGVALLMGVPSVALGQLPRPSDHVSAVDAARLYLDACSSCHGRLGDGNGRGARLLSPRPRDFTMGVFKFRSTPTGSLPRDEDLYRTVSRGVPGTWMPAWENLLTEDQRWALIRYIKGFSEIFVEEDPDSVLPVPPAPGATAETVREGRFVYAMLRCAQCHGPAGRGNGPSADELTDDWDQEILPYDFTRGNYKNGSTPTDIYRTLITGLSGSPMPAYEREMVAFPGGRDADLSQVSKTLDPLGLQLLEGYLAGQPTESTLAKMSDVEIGRLVEHRLWCLVYYLKSLDRPGGILHWLFGESPDFKARGDGR